jgi:hypothetical protein
MRAKRKDGNQHEIEEALTKAGYWWFDTSALGRGYPDLHVVSKSDISVMVEVKMPNEVLTPAEEKFLLDFEAPYEIVFSAEQMLKRMHDLDKQETGYHYD